MSHKILLIGSSSGIGLTFYFTRLAITLRKMGNEVVVLSNGKEQYVELPIELNRCGIRRYISDAIDYSDPMSVIRGVKDMRRILKKEKNLDVIHAGGVIHGTHLFFTAMKLKNRPKTFATIGWLPLTSMGMISAVISYTLFYDKCVALCNYTKRKLEKLGINSEKIHVIPLFAPDLEWFDKIKEAKINIEKYNIQDVTRPVVFYAASHYHHKGFPHYLMVASKILRNFDATFVVGGIGPLTRSLKSLAEKLGISKNVVFTGWISNYHMPYILSNIADICVSTSLIEQLPSYIMECMAAGKPVVASSVGGVPEIVMNEVNGYTVPPRNYEKMAKCIVDLFNNSEKAKEMGLAGRKMVDDQFNMETSVRKLMKVYEETIDKGSCMKEHVREIMGEN